jgi:hypothetical protein
MLVFAISTWLAAGVVEPVMRDFAGEAEVATWAFVAVPGMFAMLFGLLLYQRAARRIVAVGQSVSLAISVAIFTWLGLAAMISWLWCPGYRALRCTGNVLMVTGIVGGGPLLIASLISGFVIGVVLVRRVPWLSYSGTPPPVEPPAPPAPAADLMPSVTAPADTRTKR